jgi:outer membrane murein-binding lipoprotein Lpp
MKNFIKLSLVAVVASLSFAACNGSSSSSKTDSTKVDSSVTKVDTTKKDTAAMKMDTGKTKKDTTKVVTKKTETKKM